MSTLAPLTPEVTVASGPSPDANQVLISLVVATLRRTIEVAAMLQAMQAQTDRRFELIIVDQNQDDRLVPILEPVSRAGIAVLHLRQAIPGLSAARNLGLAAARGELIAFPDDDCWYEPDVVQKARDFFRAEPDAGGLLAHWVEHDPRQLRPKGRFSPHAWRRFKGGTSASFALFFRTEWVRTAGGFSENLGVGRYFGAGEEDDLILRLLAAGCRIDYVPDINIHHPHADVPQLTAQQLRRNRLYGRGTGAVQAKNQLPLWVIARGLVGPFAHALRAPNPAASLVLGASTVWGRIEGLAGWWLWGHRLPHNTLPGGGGRA